MSQAAELTQVEAAQLAAALGGSFPAQVATQRAVRAQALPEHLVQSQVVCGQTLGPRRGQVHLGVTVRTQHGDRGSVLPCRPGPGGGGHGEGLQLADAVRAEGVQTRQQFGLPVDPITHRAQRPVQPGPSAQIRPGVAAGDSC